LKNLLQERAYMALLMTMEESMINEECKAEVIEFLKTHKSPSVCTATTTKSVRTFARVDRAFSTWS